MLPSLPLLLLCANRFYFHTVLLSQGNAGYLSGGLQLFDIEMDTPMLIIYLFLILLSKEKLLFLSIIDNLGAIEL